MSGHDFLVFPFTDLEVIKAGPKISQLRLFVYVYRGFSEQSPAQLAFKSPSINRDYEM
jgi:hypothetical protein